MKRCLIITFTLLLLMSMSSLATNTRVLTMGDNNMILLDEANIWLFPSRINDYPNLVIGEFGSYSHEYYSGEYGSPSEFTELGIHWKFNEKRPWILATYLHNSDVVSPISSPFWSYYGSPYGYSAQFVPFNDFSLMSNQRIDLFLGHEWTIPIGFRLSLIHSSQKNSEPMNLDEEGFRIYQFAVGGTWPVPRIDIAAGLELMSWTDKGTDNTSSPATAYDESKPKGNWALYAMARRFIPGTYTIVPHAAIYYAKNEAEYYSAPPPSLEQTDKYTRFGIEVGVGLQYAPSSNAMAVIDFGLKYDKLSGEFRDTTTTYDASLKTVTIPFFKVGADVKVFRWMDLRVGATTYWDRTTRENDFRVQNLEDELSQNYANNDTYLGFGFHWGDLHVDTYTHPDLFLKGFHFISGQEQNMNFQITALYELM